MSRISSGLADVPADLTLAFTTDNPNITADGTITFADGDAAASRADENAMAVEFTAKINAILAYLRTVSDDAV